jgi:hypothetical protein
VNNCVVGSVGLRLPRGTWYFGLARSPGRRLDSADMRQRIGANMVARASRAVSGERAPIRILTCSARLPLRCPVPLARTSVNDESPAIAADSHSLSIGPACLPEGTAGQWSKRGRPSKKAPPGQPSFLTTKPDCHATFKSMNWRSWDLEIFDLLFYTVIAALLLLVIYEAIL